MSNLWQQSAPIFIQAPMEDVTDTVFRQVLVRCGAPTIFFTEFTNVDGLCSRGRDKVIHRFQFAPSEQPLIAQIWGKTPEHYHTVAQEVAQMGFAGIDINMGCPERSIVKSGCCSGLINNPSLAAEIIAAAKQGANGLPVSVKTRCGISDWRTEEWISHLLKQDIAALTLHGRIAKEMSHFPARWDQIGLAAQLRNQLAPQTKIIGNGDVSSYQDGLDKVNQYGLDGVMIGRGIFANPWIFNPNINPENVSLEERLDLMAFHVELFDATWGNKKNFNLLKKFFKIYVHGLPNATELRTQLMAVTNAQEALELIQKLKLHI